MGTQISGCQSHPLPLRLGKCILSARRGASEDGVTVWLPLEGTGCAPKTFYSEPGRHPAIQRKRMSSLFQVMTSS